ncbi:hypothetical protein PRO82_000896 [Candidatus Protochlamydia amoebophila]|nr:hypothetical protein [Candidatus Protochlamydia amoebophila]
MPNLLLIFLDEIQKTFIYFFSDRKRIYSKIDSAK